MTCSGGMMVVTMGRIHNGEGRAQNYLSQGGTYTHSGGVATTIMDAREGQSADRLGSSRGRGHICRRAVLTAAV